MANATWLVEIRVKDWIYTKTEEDHILGYVHVEVPNTADEFAARLAGFDKFDAQVQTEQWLKTKVESIVGPLNQTHRSNQFCAPDAVRMSS